MMWRMRWASYMALLMLVAGCSGAMQSYGKRLVVGKVAEELHLDGTQRAMVKASVDRLFNQAPGLLGERAEDIFAAADGVLAAGFEEQELVAAGTLIETLLDDTIAAIVDELAPLLETLRDEQIDHFEVRTRDRFVEEQETIDAPPADRLRMRQDEVIERLEKWTGSLDDQQEEALRRYTADLPDDGPDKLAADEARVAAFLEVLRRHPGKDAISEALQNAWRTREDWGPDARPVAVRQAEGRSTLRYIHALLSPKQRESMREHLRGLHKRLRAFLKTD